MSKKEEFLKLIRFSIVGVANTILDNIIFAIIIGFTSMDKNVVQTISYSIAVANSYYLNKRWTFKEKDKAEFSQVAKFIAVNVVALLVSYLILNLATSVFMLDIAFPLKYFGIAPVGEAYAKLNLMLIKFIVVTPFVMLANFVGNRLWVFNNNTER